MRRPDLLLVTAVLEVGTGLLLVVVPSVPLVLLLGVAQAALETFLIARLAGGALLAIGVMCWLGRRDDLNASQLAVLIGVLVYDVAAAGLLAYAGLFLNLAGLALWPAVVLHTALAVWCGASFVAGRHEGSNHGRQNVHRS